MAAKAVLREEDGLVVGNVEKKRDSQNPIKNFLMKDFDQSVIRLVRQTGARSIHEVGCGEGDLAKQMPEDVAYFGSDVSNIVIDEARRKLPGRKFKVKSIYDLTPGEDSAELVVCCEVLEHLDDPGRALETLAQLNAHFYLFSVPREPLWRILNVCRGAYWSACGNTPGHVQHWSRRSFTKLIGRYFTICEVRSPLPWTMVLARPMDGT